MNQVDIYVNDFRLDLFDDEEITINLSVQNVQDISKVFTDFTQGFTVPATAWNNAIFQHYYRTDISDSTITKKSLLNGETIYNNYLFRVLKDGGTCESGACVAAAVDALGGSLVERTYNADFDGRLREPARIEINSLPFRTGVVEMESVQLKGTEPYAYTLTFYGDVVTLSDLFGDDYLYDVPFSDYDHEYTDDAVYDRLTTNTYAPLFYALMSPVKNWFYNSSSSVHEDSNIAFHGLNENHGIHYYELKPALKVTAILDAIAAKYGITFTGSFLSATPFVDFSLWLHRFEGYLFAGGNDIAWQLINMNRNTGSGSQFNLTTDTWTVASSKAYDLQITMNNVNENYELGVFRNGAFDYAVKVNAHAATSVTTTLENLNYIEGDTIQLFIRPQNPTAMNYQCTDYSGLDAITAASEFSVDQTLAATYTFRVVVQDIMPEIKVKDFLAGILKMYNMVIVPNSASSFLLQPLDDWYASGTDQNYQTYFDITDYTVNRPPLFREIEFKYQDTEQILGYAYQRLFGTGYGTLRAFFTFDADELIVELPFECPLFEKLTDIHTSTLTNVLVYKSITNEANEDGTYNPYLGAPVLFYGYLDAYDISANSVAFVNSDNTTSRELTTCWYANTSNRYAGVGISDTIVFGTDLDPYYQESINSNLYNDYWSDYIVDLYSKKRRLAQVDAVLPVGEIVTMDLKNAVIWNNEKYLVNNVNLNMTTGKATFEILNVV